LLALSARPDVPGAQQASTAIGVTATREAISALITALREGRPFIPGEVIVKFKPGMNPSDQTRALSVLRGRERQGTWVGDALLVRSDADQQSDVVASLLSRQPEVEWAQPNYLRRWNAIPNDPSYSRQWNLDAIRMPQAWDINPGATSAITVAVIDSGVTAAGGSHAFRVWNGSEFETMTVAVAVNPDISAARIAPGRDFTFGIAPMIDFDGHGTFVAGTVLQETNNNLGLAGIAHRARLLPLKACVGYWDVRFLFGAAEIPDVVPPEFGGACSDLGAAQAIRFAADSGAQIANISFGGPAPAPVYLDAIQYAVSRGMFVSISAGNEFEEGNPIEYPAAYARTIDGAVAVGAVGRSNRRAFYSNTGAQVEVVAPGGDFRDGSEAGLVFQTGLFRPDHDPFTIDRPRFDRYGEVAAQGTSIAAPHVAGVAALLYSQGITSPAAIEAALKRFAVDLGTAGRDDQFGYGLIDARASLRGLGAAR
jgi:serine protease